MARLFSFIIASLMFAAYAQAADKVIFTTEKQTKQPSQIISNNP